MMYIVWVCPRRLHERQTDAILPDNRCLHKVGSISGQRRRRWPDIKPTLCKRLVLAGKPNKTSVTKIPWTLKVFWYGIILLYSDKTTVVYMKYIRIYLTVQGSIAVLPLLLFPPLLNVWRRIRSLLSHHWSNELNQHNINHNYGSNRWQIKTMYGCNAVVLLDYILKRFSWPSLAHICTKVA